MISREDITVIGHYLSRIVIFVGLLMLLPLAASIVFREWSVSLDFILSTSVTVTAGLVMRDLFQTKVTKLKFKHAMSVAAFAWVLAALFAALPLWLSGSVNSPLDGFFDAMSGWTSTGFSLIPDIDHLPRSINFWRHLLQFSGGMGIVVFMLAVLSRGLGGATRLYFSEGREERISPNISKTARIIIGMAFMYFTLGVIVLSIVGVIEGLPTLNSVFDAVCLTMASFGRGGFTPHSQSLLYYHSSLYEIVIMFIVFMGSINFAVHYLVLTGNRRELFRNIEVVMLLASITVLSTLTMLWLLEYDIYSGATVLFRKGFFTLVSAHGTAGFQTVYPQQMSAEWSLLPAFAVILAMLIGASTCSTGGGIKTLRIGIVFKMFVHEIKKIILPENAVIIEKYHHIEDSPISDKQAKNAFFVVVGYILLFIIGSTVTMSHGYSMADSMFEAGSAVSNTGLSSGIVSHSMPALIKLTFIFLMWAGRLEIMSVFVLIGVFCMAIKRLENI